MQKKHICIIFFWLEEKENTCTKACKSLYVANTGVPILSTLPLPFPLFFRFFFRQKLGMCGITVLRSTHSQVKINVKTVVDRRSNGDGRRPRKGPPPGREAMAPMK
jgi:hypothetical protein